MNLNHALSVEYRVSVWENGLCVNTLPPRKNLILDVGLDALASTTNPLNAISLCAIGTGTNPVRRDSGTVTFSRSGSTVTASSGFFEAGDVGRMLRWDSGQEVYISAFTSATQVTTTTSGAISAGEGTIYYVNRLGLQTETKRTGTLVGDSGASGTSWTSPIVEIWRTLQHTAESSPVTYREIGWSWQDTGSLFGMDLLPGSGVSLSTGQQLRVEIRLRITLSPLVSTAQPALSGIGANWTACLRNLGVQGDGYSFDLGHPSIAGQLGVFNSYSHAAPTLTIVTNHPAVFKKNATAAAYVNGSFRREYSCSITSTEFSGSIRHLGICKDHVGFDTIWLGLIADAAVAKNSTQQFNLNWSKTWGRNLTN